MARAVKVKGKYRVRSREGRLVGRTKGYRSKAAAVKAAKRGTFFSNLKKSSGRKGSLAAKMRRRNPALVRRVRGR